MRVPQNLREKTAHRLRKVQDKLAACAPRKCAFLIGIFSLLLSLFMLMQCGRLTRTTQIPGAVLSGYAALNIAFLIAALLAAGTDQQEPHMVKPWLVWQVILISGLLGFGFVIILTLIPPLEKSVDKVNRSGTRFDRESLEFLQMQKSLKELRIAGWGLLGVSAIEIFFFIIVLINYVKLVRRRAGTPILQSPVAEQAGDGLSDDGDSKHQAWKTDQIQEQSSTQDLFSKTNLGKSEQNGTIFSRITRKFAFRKRTNHKVTYAGGGTKISSIGIR